MGRIPRIPLLRAANVPYFDTEVNLLTVQMLNDLYHQLDGKVSRKLIVGEYVARDLDRAVELLEQLESSLDWGDTRFYRNVAKSLLVSLREYLQGKGRLRYRPPDWVDPYAKLPKKSAKPADGCEGEIRGLPAPVSIAPSILPTVPSGPSSTPGHCPPGKKNSRRRNSRRARAARTKIRRAEQQQAASKGVASYEATARWVMMVNEENSRLPTKSSPPGQAAWSNMSTETSSNMDG